MAKVKGEAQAGQGPACTNAHVLPPELAECSSGKMGWTFVAQVARPRQLSAGGGLSTWDLKLDLSEPMQIITIMDKHLGDPYIEGLLQEKGLDKPQIAHIRSAMRQYIDSFLNGRGIELDDGAYRMLTNMLIHLIEESSKE